VFDAHTAGIVDTGADPSTAREPIVVQLPGDAAGGGESTIDPHLRDAVGQRLVDGEDTKLCKERMHIERPVLDHSNREPPD
jgi:hypothetical protein